MWLWYILAYLTFYTSVGVVTFRRTGALALEAYEKTSESFWGKKDSLDNPCEYPSICEHCHCKNCHKSLWEHRKRRENPEDDYVQKRWGCDHYEAKSIHPEIAKRLMVNWSEAAALATFWPFWWSSRFLKLLRARGAFDDFFKLPAPILSAEERYAQLQQDIAETEDELGIPHDQRWNS